MKEEMTAKTSRRSFVIGGLAVPMSAMMTGCGGDGDTSGSASGLVVRAPTPPLITGEIGDWASLVGSVFLLTGETARIAATLFEVTPLASSGARPPEVARRQAFAAYFELEQGYSIAGDRMYQLSHGSRGIFDIYIGKPTNIVGRTVALAILN